MAIVRRQINTKSIYGSATVVLYPSTPLPGSFLVCGVSTFREIAITGITMSGVTWQSVRSASSGGTGPTSNRSTLYIAYPSNVAPIGTNLQINLSGSSDMAIVVVEYTGLYEEDFSNIGDQTGGSVSPIYTDTTLRTHSDRQVHLAIATKADRSNALTNPVNGYAIAAQAGGPSSQYVGFLEKLTNGVEAPAAGASFLGGASNWNIVLQTFKEFKGDYAADDAGNKDIQVEDQLLAEAFPKAEFDTIIVDDQALADIVYFPEEFDAIAISDQAESSLGYQRSPGDTVALFDQAAADLHFTRASSDTAAVVDQAEADIELGIESSDNITADDAEVPDILFVGGADGHPIGSPIRVRIETADEFLSSVEVEVKFGAGAYQHVFNFEQFQIPAGGDSVLTKLEHGWDLSIAPLGFWPRNTLLSVRVDADPLATPFEYSFTTADEPPLVRGITFIQAAIGRTP